MKQYYGDLADAFNSCLKGLMQPNAPKTPQIYPRILQGLCETAQEAKYVPEDTDTLDSIITLGKYGIASG